MIKSQSTIYIGPKLACSRSGAEFDHLVAEIGRRYRALGTQPVFDTVEDPHTLWAAYLFSFPQAERQWHNCHACRRFIEQYGGLVVVEADGTLRPAVFDDEALDTGLTPTYADGIRAIARIVRSSAIAAVHLDRHVLWGVEDDPTGWSHFHVLRRTDQCYRGRDVGADTGAKSTAYLTVKRALGEWRPETLRVACGLLESDALYRGEKIAGPVKWLRDLQERVGQLRGLRRDAIIWRAVAEAPEGFCHPRSSVAATLLDDLQTGASVATAAASFATKMRPDRYQRPQAPPKSGAIDAAERLFAAMGLARALERRFARIEDCVLLWEPKAVTPTATPGLFGTLRVPVSRAVAEAPDAGAITFAKFRRTVLPTATRIEVLTPGHGAYAALVTAVHADAPPILQWDREDCRIPVSWYAYTYGSSAAHWGLAPGVWVDCTGITLDPAHWGTPAPNQPEAAFLLIKGAVDKGRPGLALFPEILRGELHGVRSVIEAYSTRGTLAGAEQASACGLAIGGKGGARVRVTDGFGVRRTYSIDRWE